MSVTHKKEIDRIVREYKLRDAEKLSEKYQYLSPFFQYHMQEREWFILELIRKSGIEMSSCRLLEVGCGTGHILQRFLEFGASEVYGIDLMRGRLQEAKERYPQIHLAQGDAGMLPFPDQGFDLVVQFMCMSSILEPEVRKAMAEEMWRVVRPGGCVLHFDMRPPPIFLRLLLKLLRSFRWRRQKNTSPLKFVTPVLAVGLPELRHYFPGGRMEAKIICLDARLCKIVNFNRIIASILGYVPLFCTHSLALIKKSETAEQ